MGREGRKSRDQLQHLHLWRKLMVIPAPKDNLTIGFLYAVATSGDTWCLGKWRIPSRPVHVDFPGGDSAVV
jgi:hypothetical protein